MHGHGFSLTLISHISFTKQYLNKKLFFYALSSADGALYTLLKLFTEVLMRLSLLGELTINQVTETAGCVYGLILCHSRFVIVIRYKHIVCVCVCMFMWFMRTQICIMTWV